MRHFDLPNGLSVTELPTGSRSVTVAVVIRSGSRDDPKLFVTPRRPIHLQGNHHFAEHFMLRATKLHPAPELVADYLDGICANYNAYTDKSTIVFAAQTDRRHVRAVIAFLAEAIRWPLFTKESVDAERRRIRNEIRECLDDPSERAQLDLDYHMFPRSGLSHPVLGTEQSIEWITADRMRSFTRRVYVGKRMGLVIVGGFNPALVDPVVHDRFGPIRDGTKIAEHEMDYRALRGGLHLLHDDTQQLHCIIGWPTPGINDPRRIALGLLRNHLSHRTGSRLKNRLDSVGHGYSLSDLYWCYSDIGSYHIYFPLAVEHLLDALQNFAEEMNRVSHDLMPADKFIISLRNMSIDARTRFGNDWEAAIFAAQQMANAGAYKPIDAYLRELHRLNRSQIRQVAQELVPQRMTIIIRGKVSGLRRTKIRHSLRY